MANVQDELAAFLKNHSTLTEEDQRTKADFNARLDVLKESIKNFSDPGPIYDCVVFHDGNVWRAAVDAKEDGDLKGTLIQSILITVTSSYVLQLAAISDNASLLY